MMACLDDLRLMAALAHTAPGVSLELVTDAAHAIAVAYEQPDAALDPCQLRMLVASAWRGGAAQLLDRVVDVRLGSGLDDLGGGIFKRIERGVEQRWIPTSVPHDLVLGVLERGPADLPDDAMHARVAVDTALATTTVCLTASCALWAGMLDDVAIGIHAGCLVAELASGRIERPAQ